MRRRTALARRRRFRRLAGGVIRCLTSPWVKIYDSGTEWRRKREAYLPLVVHVPTLNDFAWIDRRAAQRNAPREAWDRTATRAWPISAPAPPRRAACDNPPARRQPMRSRRRRP